MKPNFALNLSHDGIVLLHRASSGWHHMGEVALDAPDMAGELAELRALATSVSSAGLASKLVIPNSQILYRTLPDPGPEARDAAIRAELDGATPYTLDELVWDSTVHDGQLQIAVVARETLEEAESFATEHRFNPVSFVALPDAGTFEGEPFFGRCQSADGLIGPDTRIEPDDEAIRILPKRRLPPPPADLPVAPPVADSAVDEAEIAVEADDTTPVVEDAPEAPELPFDAPEGDAQEDDTQASVEVEAPAAKTLDADAIEATVDAPSDEASEVAVETPAAPTDNAQPDVEQPSEDHPAKDQPDAQSAPEDEADTAEAERPLPPLRLSTQVGAPQVAAPKRLGPATQDIPDSVPPKKPVQSHPHVAVTSGDVPVDDPVEPPKPKAPRPGKSAPLPEPPPMPAPTPAPKVEAKPVPQKAPIAKNGAKTAAKGAALGALKTLSGLAPTGKKTADTATKPAEVAPKISVNKVTEDPEPQTVADHGVAGDEIAPLSDRAAGLDRVENTRDEAEALTVFGARRRTRAERQSPRRMGLILTVALVLALLLVGVIAGMLPDEDSTADAPAQHSSTLEQDSSADEATLAQDAPALPAQTALEEAPDALADGPAPDEEPELTPELLEQAALPEPPGSQEAAAELDMEALRAEYAATGIWPLAPENGTGETAEDDLNALYTASIDPNIASQDAGGLPDPARHVGETAPRAPLPPAPPGTRYDYDENGFIRATPDGTVTPDGAVVYAGRPDVIPQPRPGSAVNEAVEAALSPAAVDENDPARLALAGFQPKLRPDSLVENTEKANLSGMTRAELGRIQPKLRPASAQELAEEDARNSGAEEQPRTAPVVTVSLIPKPRPQNFDKLAAAARAAEAAAAAAADAGTTRTSSAAQVTARVPDSPLPKSDPANVARAATVQNAINLRKINLIGVYGSNSDRRALVRLPSGRFAKVQVGDKLDGGRVQSIASDSLTYIKGNRSHTLEIEG
jgi:type IV pilus biogenesis protein PilP